MKARRVSEVLGALDGAGVQAIVVGDPLEGSALRLVLSRHPANLVALGRVLHRLGARVEPVRTMRTTSGPYRVGDPLGTLTVTAGQDRLELLFGGPDGSFYAETLEGAEERVLAGVPVRWVPDAAASAPPDRPPTEAGRLLSLADALGGALDRVDRADRADRAQTQTPPSDELPGADR